MKRHEVPRPQWPRIVIALVALLSGPLAGQETFTDDFERPDGPVDGWTVFNGDWQIVLGAMSVTATGPSWVWAGSPPLKADVGDQVIRASVTFGAAPGDAVGRHGGLMFCASQATSREVAGMTGYTLDWIDRAEDRGFRLMRIDTAGGFQSQVPIVMGTPDLPDVPLEWQVEIEGDLIRLVADGSTIFEVPDATYRGGHVGAWAFQNGTNISLDDVAITYSPLELAACFTVSNVVGAAPLPVDFDAACTLSVNGVKSYAWDFGDGESGTGAKPTHTFLFGGSYMVTLTVTDTKDIVRTASQTILVQESTGSFSDDFERADGPVDGWTVWSGSWNIASGQLTTVTAGAENWAWAGDPAFSFPANFTMTFTLEFLVTPLDAVGRHGGVMFCATKPTHRYDATIEGYTIDWIDRVDDHGIRLIRVTNGGQTVLDIGARDVPDPPVNWEIVVEGEVIRVFGDGVVYLEARDSTYRKGVFGVWGWVNGQSLAVDDVEVTSPQVSPCFTMAPQDLVPVGVDVAFDAGCSSASGTPITTYSWDFGDGQTGLGMTTTHAYATEGPRTVQLTILTEGGLSATTERTIDAFVPVSAYEEDFERPDGAPDGWTIISGSWSLLAGALRVEVPGDPTGVNSEAWAFAGDPPARFGDFTAMELDVDFLNERPASVVGRHGGIFLFGQTANPRFQGNSGYCIDWIDRAEDHGYRFIIIDGGVARPVFYRGGTEDTDPGRRWKIEIDGDLIRLLVDGVLKIEVTDATYRYGHTGLWAYMGDAGTGFVQTIEFDNISVSKGTQGPVFHRGDANDDGLVNITDGIFILNFLFLGGPAPPCAEASNPNNDDTVNITDGIYVLNFLFLGGPAPAPPGSVDQPCGPDPAETTDLGCLGYTNC